MALGAATAHEYSWLDHEPHNMAAMDMVNNHQGASVGESFAGEPIVFGYEVRNRILDALNNGQMVMLTSQEAEEPLALMIPTDALALPGIPTPLEPPYWRNPSVPGEQLIPQ